MSTTGDVTALIVILESETTILCGIGPCIAVLAGSTISIRLTDTGALRAAEAATFAILASIVNVAGAIHRDRVGGIAPRHLAIAALALVIATGDVARIVVRLLGQALVLLEIDSRVAILATATIIVGVALLLLRYISRDRQIVINLKTAIDAHIHA